MQKNPFEILEQRFEKVEMLLEQIIAQTRHQENDSEQLGDIELAEEVTKLKRATIYSHVHQKKIPFHKRGAKLYFYKSELLKWINDGNKPSVKTPLFPRHLKN